MLSFLIGAAAAVGTYFYAHKRRHASTGKSATVAALSGAGVWAVLTAWPLLLLGGGAAAGYYYFAKKGSPKSLPPARE